MPATRVTSSSIASVRPSSTQRRTLSRAGPSSE